MYLAKMRVVGKGFKSGYEDVPPKLEEKVLKFLVSELVRGNTDVSEQIIMGHLGLTIQIVGRYVAYYPNKADDLMGVAQMTLVESVKKFAEASRDDNITGYIVSNIHGKLSHYVKEEDHTIPISPYGLQEAVQKAKKEGTSVGAQLPKFVQITKPTRTKPMGDEGDCLYDCLASKANYDKDTLEIQEIFDKCRLSRLETLIYKKLVDGYMDTEIAKDLGYSKQRINDFKKKLLAKLHVAYLMETEG